MSEKFKSELVEQMKQSNFRELKMGEGNAALTFELAKEFGFCWGVERSIELAWAARDAYPDKRLHITNELIHNPGVNDMLHEMEVCRRAPRPWHTRACHHIYRATPAATLVAAFRSRVCAPIGAPRFSS